MFSVLTCFQFHVYPVRQFLAYNVRKLRGRKAAEGDETDVSCYGRSMTRWYDIMGALGDLTWGILGATGLPRQTRAFCKSNSW